MRIDRAEGPKRDSGSWKHFAVGVLLAVGALLISSLTPSLAQTGDARATASPRVPVVFGGCNPVHVKYKVSTNQQSTTSTSYVDVVDSAIGVRLRDVGCIIVMFSSLAFVNPNETMRVQVMRVPATLCEPSNGFFISSNVNMEGLSSQAMNYVCHNVPAGIHSVKVQFRSGTGGNVILGFRTVIAWYSK